MQDLFSVKDKCIVITGGAGVLCGEMAKQLASRGAKICVVDYDVFRANQLCKEIEAEGNFAIPVEANILEKKEIENAFTCAVESMGRIDVLINGAGGNKKEATTSPDMSFFDIPADAIRFVFDLNFLGTLLPTQVFGKHMAERGDGIILNISSMNALRPLTKIAAYSAAKAAVSNFTQWLAVHMCQNYSKDIRVNAIAPGFFLTDQNRFLLTDEKTGQLTPRGKTIIDHTPMARFGDADELTGAVLWLLSDAARFVTGVVVPIDGGFSAFSGV
ncbi:MAG: SDR family oxidoreductase [Planctomycetota bacterium]|jgi:NAD(P)-dependent dehydrogenase (short-subunit alcohol dehydrogenase family)